MAGHTHFDESLEDYLEAVYWLERKRPGGTASGLAAQPSVVQVSVSEVCPDGHPIPPGDLSELRRPGVKLANLLPAAAARVIDVIEGVRAMQRYPDSIRIRSRARADLMECGPLGGPMTVINPRGRRAISIELARLITVVPEATAKLQTA